MPPSAGQRGAQWRGTDLLSYALSKKNKVWFFVRADHHARGHHYRNQARNHRRHDNYLHWRHRQCRLKSVAQGLRPRAVHNLHWLDALRCQRCPPLTCKQSPGLYVTSSVAGVFPLLARCVRYQKRAQWQGPGQVLWGQETVDRQGACQARPVQEP